MIGRSIYGLFVVATFCLMLGRFDLPNLLIGAGATGILALVFRSWLKGLPGRPSPSLSRALVGWPLLLWFIVRDVLRGTWQVTLVALGIRRHPRPAIIGLPVDGASSRARAFTGLALTLSPGSVFVDTDKERQIMWFHLIDAPDPEAERQRLKDGFQRFQRCALP